MKKISGSITGLTALSSVAAVVSVVYMQENKKTGNIEETINYINNNFDEFRNQVSNVQNELIDYNTQDTVYQLDSAQGNDVNVLKTESVTNFSAGGVSKNIEIPNIDGGISQLLLFDNMIGYMLIEDGDVLLDMNLDINMGDVDFDKLSSSQRGLLIDVDGESVNFSEYSENKDTTPEEIVEVELMSIGSANEKYVTNPDEYVNKNYSGHKLNSNKRNVSYSSDLINMQEDKGSVGQNNCLINSIYTVFRHKALSGNMNIDKDMVKEEKKSSTDPNYETSLYTSVEKSALDSGWTDTPGNYSSVSKTLNLESKKHGNNDKAWSSYWIFNRFSKIENAIKEDNPVILALNKGQYTNHAVTVTGYREYEKKHGWWIFSYKTYREMLKLNDNHMEKDTWFDWDGRPWLMSMYGI